MALIAKCVVHQGLREATWFMDVVAVVARRCLGLSVPAHQEFRYGFLVARCTARVGLLEGKSRWIRDERAIASATYMGRRVAVALCAIQGAVCAERIEDDTCCSAPIVAAVAS